MELSQKEQEDKRIRKTQRKAVKGEIAEEDWEYRNLFEKGQVSGSPLVIDDRDADADHIVTVIEDSIEEHPVCGATGTFRAIVKGKCGHCGSNRLEVGHNEPAGIGYTACAVCNRDDMSTEPEFDHEVDRK